MKSKIVKIVIERAEGPHDLCKRHEFVTIELAQVWLYSQQSTFPKNGGYDKHDVTIEYDDKEQINVRMDCKAMCCDNNDLNIMAHIKQYLGFFAGLRKPSHMSEETYNRVIKESEAKKEEFLEFIQTHECGF